HRQRKVRRVSRAEVSGQDHDALRVDGAAELDLSFDVHDLPVADAYAGGDPRRLPEVKAAEAENGQSIDLTHAFALRVDQQITPFDLLVELAAEPVHAVDLRVDGLLHVPARDDRGAAFPGAEARFGEEVGNVTDLRRQLFGIADEPRAVLD